MKAMTDRILQLLDDPEELEALYRQTQRRFASRSARPLVQIPIR